MEQPDNANLRATLIDPVEDGRWPGFIGRHPAATPFHQPGWTSAVSEVFGYEPRFQVLEDTGGEILAAWPTMLVTSRLTGRRLVCLPFCHRAGPLIDSELQAKKLLRALVDDAKALRAGSVEVRDWPPGIPVPIDLQRVDLYATHFLDFSGGPDAVLRRLSHGPRIGILRARREGVTVRSSDDPRDLEAFYGLYVKQRRRQGLLPQPLSFIRKIYEKILLPGNGFIVMAEYQDKPICALIAIGHGSTITTTHSAADLLARRVLAMALAMWKVVEVGSDRGYTRYDLGRTGLEAAGLLNFKEQWGVQGVDLPYFYLGRRSGVNVGDRGRLRSLLLGAYTRFAPGPILLGLSKPMYRHLG